MDLFVFLSFLSGASEVSGGSNTIHARIPVYSGNVSILINIRVSTRRLPVTFPAVLSLSTGRTVHQQSIDKQKEKHSLVVNKLNSLSDAYVNEPSHRHDEPWDE